MLSRLGRLPVLLMLTTLVACTVAVIEPDWVRWYGHGGENADRTHWVGDMATDSFGDLVVASSTIEPLPSRIHDALVVKYRQDGTRVWARAWDMATNGERSDERPQAVAVGPDDAVYVSGGTFRVVDGVGVPQAFVMKFSADGERVWKRLLPENEEAHGLLVTDDRLILTDRTTQIFDLNGQRLRVIQHDGFRGWKLDRDDQGNLLIAGSQQLAKFTPAGDLLWKQPVQGAVSHQASLVVSPNGEITVAAAGEESGSATVQRFTPEGQSLWQRDFAEVSRSFGLPGPALIAEDGRGDLYLSASHVDDRRLVKLSASGRVYWNTTRSSGIVQDIQPGNDGSLFVAGDGVNEKLDADGRVIGKAEVDRNSQPTTGSLVKQGDRLFVAYSAYDGDSFKINLSRYPDQ